MTWNIRWLTKNESHLHIESKGQVLDVNLYSWNNVYDENFKVKEFFYLK